MEIKLDRLLIAFATQRAALEAIATTGTVTEEDLKHIKMLNTVVEKELMNEYNAGISIINSQPEQEVKEENK